MTVTKPLVVLLVLAACDAPGRRPPDAAHDAPPGSDADAWVPPDAAPPPFDAAPLAEQACSSTLDAGMQCALPASKCLDPQYLIYYSGGACVNDRCEFETHWLYCYGYGCIESQAEGAYCDGGFT